MEADSLLSEPSGAPPPVQTRPQLQYDPLDDLRSTFLVPRGTRSYQQQFANVYFMRLAKLKPKVLEGAKRKWLGSGGAAARGGRKFAQTPVHVKRVLDVTPGTFCYIVGTVYCDMRLKPNVLEDLAREHFLAAPPIVNKWTSPGSDTIMLEDESGRVKLVGLRPEWCLVTGVIVGVLGAETAGGEFEAVDICFPGLPPQIPVDPTFDSKGKGKAVDGDGDVEMSGVNGHAEGDDGPWVALVSGLDMQGSYGRADIRAQLLAEYLTGEVGGAGERTVSRRIARVIIAGNAFAEPEREVETTKKPKRYGYDPSLYSAKPGQQLDNFLSEILPTLNVDLMPGDKDPVGTTLPQQPLHLALLPLASRYEGFKSGPNPWWAEIEGRTFLGTSGQNLDDIYKYLESDDRLGMAMNMLRWRHIAPTAPDTLWSYPFQNRDPFILPRSPHVYFIGNQPKFATGVCQGQDGSRTRVVLVPQFSNTGTIALVNPRTLECRKVTICQRRLPPVLKKQEEVVEETRIDMDDDEDDG